jgi:AAA domain, putative AbiEii toxin, Type IV TA system
VNARATPSLRIARLVVENFRTFHGPVEIPLATGGVADEVAVFHGGNGTGKSNALAAVDMFFRATFSWLTFRPTSPSDDVQLFWDRREDFSGLVPSPRDWPPGVRAPLRIDVQFAQAKTPFSITLAPAGNRVNLRMEGVWAPGAEPVASRPQQLGTKDTEYLSSVLNWIQAPFGPGSKPFFRLDARRRAYRFVGENMAPPDAPSSPLSPDLAARLLDLATSFEPLDTERWRAFIALVSRFKTLAGREVAVLRMPDGSVDLRFEIRGKQILRVSELSSGEQQVVAMCAAVLTSRAAVVAIEEPEISLAPDYQKLVRDVLREQVKSGLIDQIILESHVPVFDGPEVVRFSRSAEGLTSVTREPVGADDEFRAHAKEHGAEEEWVTPDGYTQLPEEMLHELDLDQGGRLWFLRSKPDGRWQAWKASDLNRLFGLGGDRPKDK